MDIWFNFYLMLLQFLCLFMCKCENIGCVHVGALRGLQETGNTEKWSMAGIGLGSILVFISYLVVVDFCCDEIRTVCHNTEKIKQYCALSQTSMVNFLFY